MQSHTTDNSRQPCRGIDLEYFIGGSESLESYAEGSSPIVGDAPMPSTDTVDGSSTRRHRSTTRLRLRAIQRAVVDRRSLGEVLAVTGPRECGKTTLLWQYALNAARRGQNVRPWRCAVMCVARGLCTAQSRCSGCQRRCG